MQIKGLFNEKLAYMLMDLGATHNFIHPTLLRNLKTPVSNLLPLNVMLASRAKMKTQGEVHVPRNYNNSASLLISIYFLSRDVKYYLGLSGLSHLATSCEILITC